MLRAPHVDCSRTVGRVFTGLSACVSPPHHLHRRLHQSLPLLRHRRDCPSARANAACATHADSTAPNCCTHSSGAPVPCHEQVCANQTCKRSRSQHPLRRRVRVHLPRRVPGGVCRGNRHKTMPHLHPERVRTRRRRHPLRRRGRGHNKIRATKGSAREYCPNKTYNVGVCKPDVGAPSNRPTKSKPGHVHRSTVRGRCLLGNTQKLFRRQPVPSTRATPSRTSAAYLLTDAGGCNVTCKTTTATPSEATPCTSAGAKNCAT